MQMSGGSYMGRRLFFLVLTNILVITTIVIVLSVLSAFFPELRTYVGQDGQIQFLTLFIFSAIIGFTGAFMSLAMSRFMVKQMMRIKVLDPNKGNLSPMEQRIVEKVYRLSRAAGLTHMPEVGIYDSPEVNAFATGPSKKRSLVAVSTGLLQAMDDDAVEGVIAHEVAHVANGDMVTMTLLQGVINTFVVFLARIAAIVASRVLRQDSHLVHIAFVILFQLLFSILGSIVVMAYSRYREYHADRGGADLAGKDKMVHALRSLKSYVNHVDTEQSSLQTLKINNKGGLSRLFSSHPDLDDRIRRLEAK